jgi:hypothetical protein
LEIDVQELFLGEELAKQFPESLLVFISYQMHDSGAIVESIQLRGEMFFCASILSDMLQQQLLCMQANFEVRRRLRQNFPLALRKTWPVEVLVIVLGA